MLNIYMAQKRLPLGFYELILIIRPNKPWQKYKRLEIKISINFAPIIQAKQSLSQPVRVWEFLQTKYIWRQVT